MWMKNILFEYFILYYPVWHNASYNCENSWEKCNKNEMEALLVESKGRAQFGFPPILYFLPMGKAHIS